MENRIYNIGFLIDMLFNLSINKSMMLSDIKPMTEDNREWFNMKIIEADVKVREIISFLIADNNLSDNESLCYSLLQKYLYHTSLMPMKIENALVAIVCQIWYDENGVKDIFSAKSAIEELHSLAIKQDKSNSRKTNY